MPSSVLIHPIVWPQYTNRQDRKDNGPIAQGNRFTSGRPKTAESIDMPFWMKTQVGPRNRVLHEGADPPTGRGNFRGLSHPFKKRGRRVRCKRDHSIASNVKQQKGSFCMPGSANEYSESSGRRRCGLSAGKRVIMGVHSAGEV